MTEAVVPTQDLGKLSAVPPPDWASIDQTLKRSADFNDLSERIKNAGGVATPDQRVKFSKSLAELQPEVNVLKAIGQRLMGASPDEAYKIASQGRIVPKIIYDVNGEPLEVTLAGNSTTPLKAIDMNTGKELTALEYANRKGGEFLNYKETYGATASKIQVERRAADNEAEAAITTLKEAAAPQLFNLHKQQREAYAKLGDKAGLSSEELNRLASMSSGTATYSNSLSDAYNTMKQAQKDKNTKDALQKSGKLATAIGFLSSAFNVSKEKVESAGSSDLDQLYKNASSGQGLETGYSQTQKEAFESAWYRRLDGEGKKLIEDIFQRSKNIDQLNVQSTKAGDLLIAPTPYSPEILKQAGSGELQSALGEFNAEASDAFAKWRKAQNFPATAMPSSGELQAAFTRTRQYKDLQNKYDSVLDDIEDRARQNIKRNASESKETKPTIGGIGVVPESAGTIKANQLNREVPPPTKSDDKKKTSSEDRVKALAAQIAKDLKK
jgi:hypothetical protein